MIRRVIQWPRWIDVLAGVLAVVIGVGVGAVFGAALDEPVRPVCPTEDSCSPDYRGGAWRIEPDRP
jgi:hypothetical protein